MLPDLHRLSLRPADTRVVFDERPTEPAASLYDPACS